MTDKSLWGEVDDALTDLSTLCDAVGEVVSAHVHSGVDMTGTLIVLGTQLPKTFQATSDRVLELCKEGRDDA